MSKEKLYVISGGVDGICIAEVDEEEYLKELTEDAESEGKYWEEPKFSDKIKDPDPNYWDDSILVIKGKIVVPRGVKVATKYRIED